MTPSEFPIEQTALTLFIFFSHVILSEAFARLWVLFCVVEIYGIKAHLIEQSSIEVRILLLRTNFYMDYLEMYAYKNIQREQALNQYRI